MQGIEAGAENVEPRVTIEADGASARNRRVQRAADAASSVSRALSAAGYEPRHLSVTSSDSGELVLRFGKDCGPFNAPLVIRATVETKDTPVVAEAKVEVVEDTSSAVAPAPREPLLRRSSLRGRGRR